MDNGEMILQRYRECDEAERLCLYMGYRDLREDFQAIENEARKLVSGKPAKERSEADGISPVKSFLSKVLIYLSFIIANLSLFLFLIFLYRGPFDLFNFKMKGIPLLIFNAALSLTFFIQHSIMVRKSFRNFLVQFIDRAYHGALYSLFSGFFLLSVVVLWQKSDYILVQVPESIALIMRVLFFLALVCLIWGVRELGRFDPFGTGEIRRHLKGKPHKKPVPFTIKGPYRYVRHPLYFFTLIMVWLPLQYTADRLLFNILLTSWTVIGTFLEERDLTEQFGEQYRDYRRRVSMLIPLPGKKVNE